jgi:hypothetical protein
MDKATIISVIRMMIVITITITIINFAIAHIFPIPVAPELKTCNRNTSTELIGWESVNDADMQLKSHKQIIRRPSLVCCPNEVCLENTPGRVVLNEWWDRKDEYH